MDINKCIISASLWAAVYLLFGSAGAYNNDKPCAPQEIYNRSVICVCNATYCDTITKETVNPGRFMAYTSSENGLRFQKVTSLIEVFRKLSDCSTTIELDPMTKYQTIHGFGGAVTDSAGFIWNNIQDEGLKQALIDSYFSDTGLEYNMIRTPIGGSDFSSRAYTLNDYPLDDKELGNFSLSYEDYNYKLPMIKACLAAASSQVFMVGTTWSPPAWMKTSGSLTGVGYLKEEYFEAYANYHKKFLEEYKRNNISFWAITTTNEPLNGVVDLPDFNCLGWTIEGMGSWIVDYLGPTIKNYDPTIKILGIDDQRNTLPIWFTAVMLKRPEVAQVLDGIALHFYFNDITPPSMATTVLKDYPDLFLISTEASITETKGVDLGSWDGLEKYAVSLIQDLNYNYTGWIDWNLCLDTEGGPNWVQNYVDSPIVVDAEAGVFYKQPIFYAMGHFSKFIPRGSRRIKSTEKYNCSNALKHVAFLTPENTIVVVLLNEDNKDRVIRLKFGDNQAKVLVEGKSIITVEFNNEVQDDSCDCD